MSFGGFVNILGGQIEQVHDELIRALRLDLKLLKNFWRKVFQIVRHDYAGLALDGSSRHMPVFFIGKIQAWDKAFISDHECIGSIPMKSSERLKAPKRIKNLDGGQRPEQRT